MSSSKSIKSSKHVGSSRSVWLLLSPFASFGSTKERRRGVMLAVLLLRVETSQSARVFLPRSRGYAMCEGVWNALLARVARFSKTSYTAMDRSLVLVQPQSSRNAPAALCSRSSLSSLESSPFDLRCDCRASSCLCLLLCFGRCLLALTMCACVCVLVDCKRAA